jgi:hypothetical protein
MHLPYVKVSHAIYPNVWRSMHKIFWEILPIDVDRAHTYECTTIVGSRRMHHVHPNLQLQFLFKPNGHWCNFISFKIHCLGLICVPKSKVFLVKILRSFDFDIYHVFVLYVKAQIIRWSATKSHWLQPGSLFDWMCLIDLKCAKPCWKWRKKHNMAQGERLLLMGLLLATTLLCLVKVRMETNFVYCSVTNQSIWW